MPNRKWLVPKRYTNLVPVTMKYGIGITVWLLLAAYFGYAGRARRAT